MLLFIHIYPKRLYMYEKFIHISKLAVMQKKTVESRNYFKNGANQKSHTSMILK